MAKSIKHTAKAKKDIENPEVFKSRKSNDFPQLTIKDILELLEALEKDEKDKKSAKKLSDVFGMSLDELLKSSKKDLREKAQEYELKFTPVKKPEDSPKSLLENITDAAPKDSQDKSKSKKEKYDPKYEGSNDLYQQDQYTSQTGEKESEWHYDSQIKKKKKS